MKNINHIFSVAALSVLLCSCTKDVTYHRDGIEPQLLVNAQMTVGDTLHLVYLAISKDVTVEKIKSGSVRCLINGKPAVDAVLDDRDDDLFITNERTGLLDSKASEMKQTRFSFKADFKPGDIVRIEAEANDGEFKAISEVVVPKAPEIMITDTLYQKDPSKPDSFTSGEYRIRLKGKDFAGENNYYRIKMGFSRIDKMFKDAVEDNEAKEWSSIQDFQYITLDKGDDVILNDGAPVEDLDLFDTSENLFRVFSDKMFADGTFNIGLTMPSLGVNGNPSPTEDKFDRAESESTLSVIVSGITEEEYHYLKALSIYMFRDGTIMTEPVSFPDNVEGGVGLVSISTPSIASVKFHRTFSEGGGVIWTY